MRAVTIFRSASIVMKSLTAAVIAAAAMSVLNVLVELIKGNSLFKFSQMYLISSWYILVWAGIGAALGVMFYFFFLLSKRLVFSSFSQYIVFYLYSAVWMLLIGYINIFFLPSFFDLKSVMINLILIGTAFMLLIFLFRKTKLAGLKTFPSFLRLVSVASLLIILSSLGVHLVLSASGSRAAPTLRSGQDKFNVLIVVLDALRFDHLSCHGYERETTPNIDRIARDGLDFQNAFAHSSHTAESVPSMFTSTYPSTHGVRLGSRPTLIPDDLVMMPSIFKANGYKTGFFSIGAPVSSILGYQRDIDEFYEPQSNLLRYTILGHFLKLVPSGNIIAAMRNFTYHLFQTKHFLDSSSPDHVLPKVITWISRNKERPFFLYVHLKGPHLPYYAPVETRIIFDPDPTPNPILIPPDQRPTMYPFGKQQALAEDELENILLQYDSALRFHDDNLGILFDYLEQENLDSKTIMILTADHGEEFYDHYGWRHIYSLFDELIHVPLIFYCPGMIPARGRIDDLIGHVDIFPTIFSLCGLSNTFSLPYEIEGMDFSSLLLNGDRRANRDYIFSETNIRNGLAAWCLRTKEKKALKIQSGAEIRQLYFDLVDDPMEKNDIFARETSSAGRYFELLESLLARSKDKAFTPEKTSMDEKTKEQLKALGYIK